MRVFLENDYKKNEKEKEMKHMAQSVKAAKTCFV